MFPDKYVELVPKVCPHLSVIVDLTYFIIIIIIIIIIIYLLQLGFHPWQYFV
jgi:hypothetical protein